MEKLTCEQCNKSWKRQPTRGRKPRLCPKCLATAQPTIAKAVAPAPSKVATKLSQSTNSEARTYKFPAPTKWLCTSCHAKVEIGVSLDHEPTHSCVKRLKRILPLELIRAKEA